MTGTFHAIGGLRRFTRLGPRWNVRLAWFALAVGLVAVLIVWIQRNVGSRVALLEQEFGALQAESFYVGVRLRIHLRHLNERLLDYHLTQSPRDREDFLANAAAVRRWLQDRSSTLNTADERGVFQRLQVDYDRYLAGTRALIEPPVKGRETVAFRSIYHAVQQQSQPLLDLIDRFVKAQQNAFNGFLTGSQEALLSLQRLLTLSLVLLLGSTMALAVLVYRGMIAPLRDEVSQSRAIIERQEKLASLGTLAAGVAHEIRNPLTAIKFRLFSLEKSLPELADHEDAGVISSEINRLDRIVKDFLRFARPSEPSTVRVPAERIVQEVSDLMGTPLMKSGIDLRIEASGTTWIQADTEQIKQVLINLVQNAAEAIGRDGVVRLSVIQAEATVGGQGRPAAILRVADTGKGIPPEVQKRLFDPFFTTKDGGTGLGLSVAARIVEKHDGMLRYQTMANHGTTFELVLPRLDDYATPTSGD